MIHVIATIEVAPGRMGDFLEALRGNLPHVLAEEGCVAYEPTRDVDTGIPAQGGVRPDVVTMVERWETLAALRAHLQAPHMHAFREKVKDCVARVNLQITEPVT